MHARLFAFFLLFLGSLVLLPLPTAISQDAGKKQVTLTVQVPDTNAVLTIDGAPPSNWGSNAPTSRRRSRS